MKDTKFNYSFYDAFNNFLGGFTLNQSINDKIKNIYKKNPIYFLNTNDGWKGNLAFDEFQMWYFIENPQADMETFYNVLEKLESGKIVHLNDNQSVQKSGNNNITYTHKDSGKLPDLPKNTKCLHTNKYINSAGGVKFYYCKDCKTDLGDVED